MDTHFKGTLGPDDKGGKWWTSQVEVGRTRLVLYVPLSVPTGPNWAELRKHPT